jgi:Golgi apparatus protein 1
MRNVTHSLIGLGCLSLLVIRPIGPASAQADIAKAVVDKLTALAAKVESSCADDIKKYCSTVTPGEGRIIYCMQAHEDKISPKCTYDLEEAATNVQTSIDSLKEAIVACKAEITGVCGNIAPGQGRIAACLITNKSAASKGCSEALQKIEGLAQ